MHKGATAVIVETMNYETLKAESSSETFLLEILNQDEGLCFETANDTILLFCRDEHKKRFILKSLKVNLKLNSKGCYGHFLDSHDKEIAAGKRFKYKVGEKHFETEALLASVSKFPKRDAEEKFLSKVFEATRQDGKCPLCQQVININI